MNPFFLVFLGLLLIFIEFYLPGMVMGIIGAIIIFASIILFAVQQHSPLEVFLFISAVFASLAFLISFTLKRIPKAKANSSIYLKSDQEGYFASSYDAKLVGKKGKALSDLKPSGYIYIEGQQYQAISQSGYIVKGTEITVIGGRGAYLIVKD